MEKISRRKMLASLGVAGAAMVTGGLLGTGSPVAFGESTVTDSVYGKRKKKEDDIVNTWTDTMVESSFGGPSVYSDYSLNGIKRFGSFANGAVLTDSSQALKHTDGNFYVFKGMIPVGGLVVPNTAFPDSNWVNVGTQDRRNFTTLYASDFGAREGQNIHIALQKLAAAANALSTNFLIDLDIRHAYVGGETINPSPSSSAPYYQSWGTVLNLIGCSNFEIKGNGCQLQYVDGLHFGSFDPTTGIMYEATGNFTNPAYAANPGNFLSLTNCSHYQTSGITVDGNNTTFVLGGHWGDTGIQLQNCGLREFNCIDGMTLGCTFEYFGLDGCYIGSTGNTQMGLVHIKVNSRYSGRQGLSFTGGNQIELHSCDYSHTGMGGVFSSPGAGVDFEPNGSYDISDVMITNPRIIGNRGAAVLALRCKKVQIYGGELEGGTSFYNATTTVEMVLRDVTLRGGITNCKGTNKFYNCTITSRSKWGSATASRKLIENVCADSTFEDCFIESGLDLLYLVNGNYKNCTVEIYSDTDVAVRSRVGVISGGIWSDCAFRVAFNNQTSDLTVAGEHAYISSGPNVKFRGLTQISGSQIAWGGRAANPNILLATYKDPGAYNYGSTTVSSIVNGNGTYDFLIGVGFFIVSCSSITGLSTFSYSVVQQSYSSSVASSHSLFPLGTGVITSLGVGGAVAPVVINGKDYIRVTTTADLSSATMTITRIALNNLAASISVTE